MKSLTLIAAVSCICAIQATQVQQRSGTPEGLSEYESFTSALNDNNNKNLRSLQDIRTVQASPLTSTKRISPSRSNIVYGKGRYAEQPKFTRHHYHPTTQKPKIASPVKNFKPSPEDSFEIDNQNQYAQNFKLNNPDSAVLQKYMEKYAQQLYAAQKHATQLSESQKYVLGQDPYSKKFSTSQPQVKYSAPKFIPFTTSSESKATSSSSISKFPEESLETAEPVTEKFPNYSVAQKLVVQTPKVTVSKSVVPKKAYSYSFDNTPQSTDYKYSNLYGNTLEPQVLNQFLTYGSEDRDSLAGYEQAYAGQYGAQFGGQYGASVGISDKAEIPKITGYKIPGAVSLSYGHGLVEEKEHKEHAHHGHEEHYPHAEPKYEFMYQVKDPEKHNHFGHSEARKGKMTTGKYFVQLPDGRLETVKYWADKTGYHAEVDFKGQAKHPSHKEYSHKEHHHHHHHGLERLEDVNAGALGTSYVGQSGLIGQAGLGSHQDYSIAEQAEEYQ